MFDPIHSLSDTPTGIPQNIIAIRSAVEEPYDAANSAGVYWARSGCFKSADGYYSDPTNSIEPVATTGGSAKHYYQNPAFTNVAATVKTGALATSIAGIWGIEARFLASTNAQVVLMVRLEFEAGNGSLASMPQDFSPRRID